MNILLTMISSRRSGPTGPTAVLLELYMARSARYAPCTLQVFPSEDKFLQFLANSAYRTRPTLLLADGRGQQLTSEDLASLLGTAQDTGIQHLILAIGPADGWSAKALAVATRTIAFGRITLPHELAAVIAAEQIYRALTIRAGHPYHSGH